MMKKRNYAPIVRRNFLHEKLIDTLTLHAGIIDLILDDVETNVTYECIENADECEHSCMNLNSLVKSITISSAINKGENNGQHKKYAYYEDCQGSLYCIVENDIYQFLLKTPKLIISRDEVLIFYTERDILATKDCQHYVFIHEGFQFGDSDDEIIEIVANESDCTIITGRMVYEGKGKSRIGRLKKNQYILRFQIEQGKLDMSIR